MKTFLEKKSHCTIYYTTVVVDQLFIMIVPLVVSGLRSVIAQIAVCTYVCMISVFKSVNFFLIWAICGQLNTIKGVTYRYIYAG